MTDPGGSSLSDDITEITDRLNRLTGFDSWLDISDHGTRLDRLEEAAGDHSVSELSDQLDRLQRQLEEATSAAGATTAAVQAMAERVRLLERRQRVSAQIPLVDLDHWAHSVTALAKTVRAGLDARADVLYVSQRNQWLAIINRPGALRDTVHGHRVAAAAAARRMAELGHDEPGWSEAITAWNDAIVHLQRAGQDLTEAIEHATIAEEKLAAATTRNNAAAPKVKRGEDALAALHTRIRTRISDAVRDDKVFPAWFETILGGSAPSTNTARWLNLAVRVVTYRFLTNVTDSVLALGDCPDGSAGWQRKDYDDLLQECGTIMH